MWKFESALVPLDGTHHGKAALGVARTLVDGQSTHLIHVLDEIAPHIRRALFPYAPLGEDEPLILDEMRRLAAEHLADALKLKDAQLERLDIVFGRPADQIAEHAIKRDADLVICGAFGQWGARPAALGSVTSGVVAQSTVPVWVARDYGAKRQVNSILVAVDLSPATSDLLTKAASLAIKLDATLEILHVIPDPLTQDDQELVKQTLRVDKRQIISKSKEKVDALFERILQKVEVPFPEKERVQTLLSQRRIVFGRPSQEVVSRAQEVDLVVLGRQSGDTSKIRIGSVAQAVLNEAASDILISPA
jgi:nucleotide-binding universal stress UspA family protein